MSETPHVTDVELSRALNALVATLNDQRATEPDVTRWQAIVTGSLGGEERIRVTHDELAQGVGGLLHDAQTGKLLASLHVRDGRWTASREGAPLTGGYVPS